MSNPFNEVLIFKALADEHWKQIRKLQRENAALRGILRNVRANNWDAFELASQIDAAIDAARKEEVK